MFELIVIWDDGSQQVIPCKSLKAADDAERGFQVVFGAQVAHTYIRRA